MSGEAGVNAWLASLESGQEAPLEHEHEFHICSAPVADVIDLLQGRNGVLVDMSKQGWKLVTTTSHINGGKLVYCDTFRWDSDQPSPGLDPVAPGVAGAGDEEITVAEVAEVAEVVMHESGELVLADEDALDPEDTAS